MTGTPAAAPSPSPLRRLLGGLFSGGSTRPEPIRTDRFFVLAPVMPFVNVILQSNAVDRRDFERIVSLATAYGNDPRMVQLVRKAGDASAKVPYLLAEGETPEGILAVLRELARPHVDRIRSLPDSMQAAIHLLLSINALPRGCEECGIPALLEIDRIQVEMVRSLRERMRGRALADEFHRGNLEALQALDTDWPRLRRQAESSLPAESRVQYQPYFNSADRLSFVQESCVIVNPPYARALRRYTPPVLRNPLGEKVPVPETGSEDWLIRNVGKIGRHFTRALLDIIRARLAREKLELEARNYRLINERALDALREFIESGP